IGNLDTRRDFTDVRDVARAYVALATAPKNSLRHTVYNVCSGKSLAGKRIFDLLCKTLEINKLKTVVDPAKLRQHDVADIFGSYDRLHSDTGWQPKIPIEQTVNDFVNWRARP